MKDIVQQLKKILDENTDQVSIQVLLCMGTVYRINKCIINPSIHDSDLYEVKSITKDPETGVIILKIT